MNPPRRLPTRQERPPPEIDQQQPLAISACLCGWLVYVNRRCWRCDNSFVTALSTLHQYIALPSACSRSSDSDSDSDGDGDGDSEIPLNSVSLLLAVFSDFQSRVQGQALKFRPVTKIWSRASFLACCSCGTRLVFNGIVYSSLIVYCLIHPIHPITSKLRLIQAIRRRQ